MADQRRKGQLYRQGDSNRQVRGQRLDNRQELRHAFQFSCKFHFKRFIGILYAWFPERTGVSVRDTINGLNFGRPE